MKQRIIGRVGADHYEIVSPAGDVVHRVHLSEAKSHSKLQAAIKRNKWETI
jgi:hypothetical protein